MIIELHVFYYNIYEIKPLLATLTLPDPPFHNSWAFRSDDWQILFLGVFIINSSAGFFEDPIQTSFFFFFFSDLAPWCWGAQLENVPRLGRAIQVARSVGQPVQQRPLRSCNQSHIHLRHELRRFPPRCTNVSFASKNRTTSCMHAATATTATISNIVLHLEVSIVSVPSQIGYFLKHFNIFFI